MATVERKKMTVGDYIIHPNWLEPMRVQRFANRTVEAIIHDAMQRLLDSFGKGYEAEAKSLYKANKPLKAYDHTMHPFLVHLNKGEFKYNASYKITIPHVHFSGGAMHLSSRTITMKNPTLSILGPSSDMVRDDAWGLAPISGWHIQLNYLNFLEFMLRYPTTFPQDDTGLVRAEVLFGCTIIHEMMHNEGYTHPDSPGTVYDPTHEYWRTYPEYVERAYLNYHIGLGNFPSGFFLTAAGLEMMFKCGTH